MGLKMKRAVLSLLALSMLAVSGTAFAEDNGKSAAQNVSETDAEPEETTERVNCESAYITEYLKKIGTVSGYDIYRREKGFEDAMWAIAGGKPAKKSDYTAEQKELDDIVKSLKLLGDFIAVDSKTGEAAADFKKGSKCKEGKLYVSNAGRFLLTVNEELTKPLKLLEIVSAEDDSCIYGSADGKTLVLTDRRHTKIEAVYRDSGLDGDKRVFSGENGFVWTSPDRKQVLGAFRYSAENENYRMIVSERLGGFGLENKKTGYIWWSVPLGASSDERASKLIRQELSSTSVLRYGKPESRNNNNFLRSGSEDCEISVKDIKNGIRVTYSYSADGFSYPVEYTLEDDCVKASLKVSEIKESVKENIATEITLLGSFGAGDTSEEGYFVVPDGSGALIRFNNNKTTQSDIYRRRIYGDDITAVPTSKGAVTEQVYLPVYGIVKGDNAMLAVASKGGTNAYLSAEVSGQSNSSYNLCNFTFILRDTDDYYMSGSSGEHFTAFEQGDIKSDDIEIRYYPISEKGADYTDIAAKYREYLLSEENVSVRSEENDSPLYVNLYGGVIKKKPLLGIPVRMKTSLTDYSQAEEILSQLRENGVDDMAVSYKNWTNDGIKSKVDTSAKPSGKLGGRSGFNALRDFIDEGGDELYPVSDSMEFYSGSGYSSFSGTAVRISGSYSRIVSYDRAYGVPNGLFRNKSLLSPSYFEKVSADIVKNYGSAGLSGVSAASSAAKLYGDYGKKRISRFNASELIEESLKKLDGGFENGVLAETANAYALPYVSRISGVPVSSGRFDIFDEDIPFYQLVMHGVIPYSTRAVNGSPDPETLVLKAAACGSSLCFDMIYEEPSELKDTPLDTLYYADYRWWTDTAADYCKKLAPMLKAVSDSFIEDYSADGDVITTVYSNGTEVITNLAEKTVEYNGTVIKIGREGGED